MSKDKDLNEFFEKVGTDVKKGPNWAHTFKENERRQDGHACCGKCGYCLTCGDCRTFGCGRTKPLSEVVKVSGSARSCPPPWPSGDYWND